MENAIYGGRVDNTFDMRVLISYLDQCFNDTAITGQAATPTRTGKKILGLPFGNIPVSLRTQVCWCTCHAHLLLYSNNITVELVYCGHVHFGTAETVLIS